MEPVPQVLKSTISEIPVNRPVWKKRLPLIVLGLLGLIILLEIIWGIQTLFLQEKLVQPALVEKILDTSTPQLVATPLKPQFSIGDNVQVNLKVVTGGKPTDSTDVIVFFDPKYLEASDSNFVELGQIYSEYPVANFDNVKGIVQISGTSISDATSFSGIGTLATLNFRAKAVGNTQIKLDFSPGSTADSNIVLSDTADDILLQVINADIIIAEDSTVFGKTSETVSCSGYYQYCQKSGNTGKQFCQKGSLQNSVCTFDPVLTVSCGECLIE